MVSTRNKPLRQTAVAFLVWTLALLAPMSGGAQDRPAEAPETHAPQKIKLVVGKSVVLDSPAVLKRVSLADPEIADALVISPRQVYLTGKAVGVTNLTLWKDNDGVVQVYDLEISPNLSRLKENLQEILPGEDIRVTATHDAITLFGNVSSTEKLSQALEIAQAFKPKKTINLMQVSGVHQVMLEVRVAEMSRSLTKRFGFNFTVLSGESFGVSQINSLTTFDNFTTLIGPSINALFGIQSGATAFTGFIDALKEHGLVKILAEPTLVTLSGQEASFLAGGEFPIPVPQREETITIEFKEFGVGLRFTPNVLNEDKISIRVTPEVSELDFSNSVFLSGFVVPALTTRRASTVIELGNGQSFAIAGLLQENVREVISKFPLLGDIPILGALFRSTSFQKNESELIIIVTPHLVKPLDMAKQTLPTDSFIEPNDFELFLLGQPEGQRTERRQSGLLDGTFGYITPVIGDGA